jgi:hypothetical protein
MTPVLYGFHVLDLGNAAIWKCEGKSFGDVFDMEGVLSSILGINATRTGSKTPMDQRRVPLHEDHGSEL